MVGVLPEFDIDALLLTAKFAHLGCHANGTTYVVPISYAYDGKRVVSYTTEGLKIELMRQNPEVCVQVEDVVELTNWRSVVLWGTFQELTGTEAADGVGMLIDRYGPIFEEHRSANRLGRNIIPPRVDARVEDDVVYCVNVREKTGRYERPDPL